MNIKLIATAVSNKNKIDKMNIVKIRGCNRNEDCVYFDSTHYITYEITDESKYNKDKILTYQKEYRKERRKSYKSVQ